MVWCSRGPMPDCPTKPVLKLDGLDRQISGVKAMPVAAEP